METEIFQHYQILRRADGTLWELGRGAMAVTFKAIDNNLCCPVALKVVSALNLEDEQTRARFIREARAAAALRHRNIASVFHLGNDEESYFYAMEYIDGETVEDLVLRRGALPPVEALELAGQVARALGAAAKQGLVHRDIKPANLMVVREDDEEALVVKVIDFGLARRGKLGAETARITVSGFVGTPQYASPEQIEERDLDSRSDIYSLGVTLWFMLAGQPMFAGPVAWISSQHLKAEPPWKTVENLPAPVRALLARMLQKNPADRPQEPAILRREITTCLAEIITGATARTEPSAAAAGLSDVTILPPLDREQAIAVAAGDMSEDETVIIATPEAVPQGPPPAPGELFAERFQLLEAIGHSSTGQMFRATDRRHHDRPVAVKVLRPDLGLGRVEFHHLQGDLRRLRAAPHPCLVEIAALEQSRGYRFIASEWINGCTLVDLLRQRGRLELVEALRLFADASAAAAHGSANGLHRLQLSPQQILIAFPAGTAGGAQVRAILGRPLAQWPEFHLKIAAIAPAGEAARTPTWAGAATHVASPRGPGRDTQSSIRGLVEGSYFYALGALLYELLNGAAPPTPAVAGRAVPPLPMLGEEANALLERALSPNPGFRDEREFFDALLAASGLERADVAPAARGREIKLADATVVPAAGLDAHLEGTLAPKSTTPSAMVPTIRTTPLRRRSAHRSPDGALESTLPPRNRKKWLLMAGGLVVVVIGIFFLRPQHVPPPSNAPWEDATPASQADDPADSPNPAPTPDASSPALPAR